MSSVEERSQRLFERIDADDSGLISRRELEVLMVQQGGVSAASASMSADKLFAQANMGNTKQITRAQFFDLFNSEKKLRGLKSAEETLTWFESLVDYLPPVYHHHHQNRNNQNHRTQSHTSSHNDGAATHEDIELRAARIFKQIDADDSGLISRRELEVLMVQQGGVSAASASMSADKLFAQANMGNARQIEKDQFLHLFTTEKRLRGAQSANETLTWFESLIVKLPIVYQSHQRSLQQTEQVSPSKPVWFEKPIVNHSSTSGIPSSTMNQEVGVPEERPNTAVRNITARAEARRKARGGDVGTAGDKSRHPKKRTPEKTPVHKTGGLVEHYERTHHLDQTVGVSTLPRLPLGNSALSEHNQPQLFEVQSQFQAESCPGFAQEMVPPNINIPPPQPPPTSQLTHIASNDTPAPVAATRKHPLAKDQIAPVNKVSNRRRSNQKHNGKSVLNETGLSGDVNMYNKEGKDGKRVFHIAGCDARMEVAFKRIDIDGAGKVSRRELLGHMEICREHGGEAGIGPSTSAFECIEASHVKTGGSFSLEDFAHLFRAEKEARGEASAMALLQWFEMLANRLPPTVAMQRIDEDLRLSPTNPGSFLPPSLDEFDMFDKKRGNISPSAFTTPPSTATGVGRSIVRNSGDDEDGGDGSRRSTERASHSPHPNKEQHLVDREATEALGNRLEQVASRAEARKQKKREVLYERAESLYYTMLDLKHDCLLGPTSWGSEQHVEEGITVEDLVVMIMSGRSAIDIQKVDAMKSAKDIFKQAGVDTDTFLTAESLVQYARNEIALRGDRSCDDMIRSLESLCVERGMARDSIRKDSNANDDVVDADVSNDEEIADRDMSSIIPTYQNIETKSSTAKEDETNKKDENSVLKENVQNKKIQRDIDPNKPATTSMELKNEIMKTSNAQSNEWWAAEENVEGEENEEIVSVSILKGAAEEEAIKSLRGVSSFHVPKLQGTPHGQDDQLPFNVDKNELKEEKQILERGTSDDDDDELMIVTKLGDEEVNPTTVRVSTAKSPTANSGDIPPVPDYGGSPSSTMSSDASTSSSTATDKAARLTKAAAVARAHYLRTAVDPVFVPLLDSVVFHKPRDVTTFVAERCLKDLLARGSDAEKEVVKAMMQRLLSDL